MFSASAPKKKIEKIPYFLCYLWQSLELHSYRSLSGTKRSSDENSKRFINAIVNLAPSLFCCSSFCVSDWTINSIIRGGKGRVLIKRLEVENSLLRKGIFQNLINRNAKLIAMHESAGSLLADEKCENFNLIIGKIQLKSSKDSIWNLIFSELDFGARNCEAMEWNRLASMETHSWLITTKEERKFVRRLGVLALERSSHQSLSSRIPFPRRITELRWTTLSRH